MKTKYKVLCPLSGLSITLEHDSENVYFPWGATLRMDIGGWKPVFLVQCGKTPEDACSALNDAISTVSLVVWNLSPDAEQVSDKLQRLWMDTLNLDVSPVSNAQDIAEQEENDWHEGQDTSFGRGD